MDEATANVDPQYTYYFYSIFWHNCHCIFYHKIFYLLFHLSGRILLFRKLYDQNLPSVQL